MFASLCFLAGVGLGIWIGIDERRQWRKCEPPQQVFFHRRVILGLIRTRGDPPQVAAYEFSHDDWERIMRHAVGRMVANEATAAEVQCVERVREWAENEL